jgi:transposase
LRRLINSTVSDVSRQERVGAEAVEGLLNRRVAQAVEWASLKALGGLGLDEMAIKKGHRDFVAIVSAPSPGGALSVLAVLPDRWKETVKGFLASIPERLKATLTRACTDRDDGFINAVREVLPHARVVVERFHVAKASRACADQWRKPEIQRLKAELPKETHAVLKGT